MRILQIREYKKGDDPYQQRNLALSVKNENGEDLQGTIHISNLDNIEFIGGIPAQYNGGYFVFNPAESKPKKIYDTYEEAYRDAREVAARYTEAKVYVLQIVTEIKRESYVKTVTTDKEGNISETFDNDKVPF